MYSYGAGGPTSIADRPLLRYLDDSFAENGYRVPDLMRTIAMGFAYPLTVKRSRLDPNAPRPVTEAIPEPELVTDLSARE
jgi:hypothetical protein